MSGGVGAGRAILPATRLGGVIVSSGNIEEKIMDCHLKVKERIEHGLRKLSLAMRCPTLGFTKNGRSKNVK
jgi:hypothetical protein